MLSCFVLFWQNSWLARNYSCNWLPCYQTKICSGIVKTKPNKEAGEIILNFLLVVYILYGYSPLGSLLGYSTYSDICLFIEHIKYRTEVLFPQRKCINTFQWCWKTFSDERGKTVRPADGNEWQTLETEHSNSSSFFFGVHCTANIHTHYTISFRELFLQVLTVIILK